MDMSPDKIETLLTDLGKGKVGQKLMYVLVCEAFHTIDRLRSELKSTLGRADKYEAAFYQVHDCEDDDNCENGCYYL